MRRNRSQRVINRDEEVLKKILKIKGEHPLWGYRRVWSYLKYRLGENINKKRIYRVMKENSLLVTKNVRLKAKRTNTRPKPRASRPNQFWGIDMTKILIGAYGWMYLVIVLDWYTKEIIGHSFGMQSKARDWLNALNEAVNKRFPLGIRESKKEELFLISDNGCQPTSEIFMKECSELEIKQIWTTWSNPKGNADTERVMRTLKEDIVWTNDWDNPFEFEKALEKWINDYNTDLPHQALNNLTPEQFRQKHEEQIYEPILP